MSVHEFFSEKILLTENKYFIVKLNNNNLCVYVCNTLTPSFYIPNSLKLNL